MNGWRKKRGRFNKMIRKKEKKRGFEGNRPLDPRSLISSVIGQVHPIFWHSPTQMYPKRTRFSVIFSSSFFFPFSSFFAHNCPFKQRRGSIRWIVSCQTARRQLRRKGYLGRRKGKNANAISALDSIFLRDLSFLFFSSSSFFSRVIRFMAAQRGLDLELERVL